MIKFKRLALLRRYLKNALLRYNIRNLKFTKTIRNCVFSYKCTKEWDELESINGRNDAVRYCNKCKNSVYLVTTEKDLAYRIFERSCVAIPEEFGSKIFMKHERSNNKKPLLGAIKIK